MAYYVRVRGGGGLSRGFTVSALQWWLLLPSCAAKGEQTSVVESGLAD